MKYKKLPLKDLLQMKVGDSFVAYYAKDDDPENVRVDYERFVIRTMVHRPLINQYRNTIEWYVETDDDLELTVQIDKYGDLMGNAIDMAGRGYCYIFEDK